MKRMGRWLILVAAVPAIGCAHIHLKTVCPANSTGVAFALQGSQVGNQLLSMAGAAGKAAGFMAKQGATAPPPQTEMTMDYTYVPIFGSDGGSGTCVMPASGPTVITVPQGPPPAAVLLP